MTFVAYDDVETGFNAVFGNPNNKTVKGNEREQEAIKNAILTARN